ILAGVITVSAAQDFTFGRLAVALAYSIGSAAVLYALMVGGRRITDRLAAYRRWIQPALGAVMIAVAVVMATNLDVRFENSIASHLPDALRSDLADRAKLGRVGRPRLAARRRRHGAGGRVGRGGGREAAARSRRRPR